MKNIVQILIFSMCLAGCSTDDGWETYSYEDEGYSMRLPREWVQGKTTQGATSTSHYFIWDKDMPTEANITVTTIVALQPGTAAWVILDEFKSIIPENFNQRARKAVPIGNFSVSRNWKETKNQKQLIDGKLLEWFEFSYDAPEAKIETRGATYVFLKEGRAFAVTITTEVGSSYSTSPYKMLFDKIIEGFEFL